jgi:hypothetical protein
MIVMLSVNGRPRSAALRPLANKGVCVHVQRYILAKAKAFAADLPSARAGEKRSGPGSTTERRVAFWEMSVIDGLPAALQFKLQGVTLMRSSERTGCNWRANRSQTCD